MGGHGDGRVPDSAWEAADEAFDAEPRVDEGDELYRALFSASPHIRIAELRSLIERLSLEADQVSDSGLKNGLRMAAGIMRERMANLHQTIL